MADQAAEAVWRKLGAEPGLCAACQYPKLNQTRRGTVYLRCGRAEWDSALPRYPRALLSRPATSHHLCSSVQVICPDMYMQKRCEVGQACPECPCGQPSRLRVANRDHAAVHHH